MLFKVRIFYVFLFLLAIPSLTEAQVKITDNSNETINKNAILELGSTTKGMLPPFVVLQSLSSPSPLTATVLEGMLVCDTTGTNVPKGYYYWNGDEWVSLGSGNSTCYLNTVAKSESDTVLKSETMILASAGADNDYFITLTLPSITLMTMDWPFQ